MRYDVHYAKIVRHELVVEVEANSEEEAIQKALKGRHEAVLEDDISVETEFDPMQDHHCDPDWSTANEPADNPDWATAEPDDFPAETLYARDFMPYDPTKGF
jgi:hypothetical protein